MEGWLLLLALGAAGYAFISPLLSQIIAKVYPSATGTTATIINALAVAGGVIIAVYVGKEVFGRRVKEV